MNWILLLKQKKIITDYESKYEFESGEVEQTTSFPATSSIPTALTPMEEVTSSEKRLRRNTEYDDSEYPGVEDSEQQNEEVLTTEEDKIGEVLIYLCLFPK